MVSLSHSSVQFCWNSVTGMMAARMVFMRPITVKWNRQKRSCIERQAGGTPLDNAILSPAIA
jgi:hypothetical protein